MDTVAQVKRKISKLIDTAEKHDGELRIALVEKGYEHLRNLAEIVVEHEMLKGVVQRYAPNVMMTKLDKIAIAALPKSMASIVSVFAVPCVLIQRGIEHEESSGTFAYVLLFLPLQMVKPDLTP